MRKAMGSRKIQLNLPISVQPCNLTPLLVDALILSGFAFSLFRQPR
jgi:hypothetical protein